MLAGFELTPTAPLDDKDECSLAWSLAGSRVLLFVPCDSDVEVAPGFRNLCASSSEGARAVETAGCNFLTSRAATRR